VLGQEQDAERAERQRDRARRVVDAKIIVLQAEAEGDQAERIVDEREQRDRLTTLSAGRVAMNVQRAVDTPPGAANSR
jgi:hypothetical protein